MNVYISDRDPTVKPGAGSPNVAEWTQPTMVKVGPATRLEPDTRGATTDFEMISITVSDSSPRQRALMLLETDKPSRVTLMAVGTNQNCFTASAEPRRRYDLPNPSPKPVLCHAVL